MKTWSIEKNVLRLLDFICPPFGHDVDAPDAAEQVVERASGLCTDCDCVDFGDRACREPALTPDELVAVRQLIEERFPLPGPYTSPDSAWGNESSPAAGSPAPAGEPPAGIPLSRDDLLEAAMCVRYWSEADTCDDRPDNIAKLRGLEQRLRDAAGAGPSGVLLW